MGDKKSPYKDSFYRNFSMYHMFNKGLMIPELLKNYVTDKWRRKGIDKHNERLRNEKRSGD